MSLTLNYPATDSASQVSKGITIPSLTWSSDWAKTSDLVANGNRLTNITAPTNFPEVVESQTKERANVFAGTTLDRSYWPATTKGGMITQDLRTTPYLTDSEDPTFFQGFPIKFRLECTYPLSQHITEDVLAHEFARFVATFYESDEATVNGWFKRHMRRATLPKDL
jgi:hypothetical protein